MGLKPTKEDGVNSELILLERKGPVAVVTINRPERKNAFNESLFNRLGVIAQELKARLPRVVVIRGKGETSFCAGFDVNPDSPMLDRVIKAMSSGDSDPAKQLIRAIRKTVDDFISIPVPLIAALKRARVPGWPTAMTRRATSSPVPWVRPPSIIIIMIP